MIKIVNDKGQEIWLRDSHAHYVNTIIYNFDYYFNATHPLSLKANYSPRIIVDYSEEKEHWIKGFNDFPILCPSLPEVYSSIQQYLDFAKLKEGDVVWDLGAYVGLASIAFAKVVGKSGVIHSIEPDHTNYLCLLRNISKFHGPVNIFMYELAFDQVRGIRSFSNEGSMGSGLEFVHGIRGNKSNVLCDTIESFGIGRVPNFIKMDIEGAEIPVLYGGFDYLEKYKPRMIIEPHKVKGIINTNEIKQVLDDIGYTKIDVIEQYGIKNNPLITAEFL